MSLIMSSPIIKNDFTEKNKLINIIKSNALKEKQEIKELNNIDPVVLNKFKFKYDDLMFEISVLNETIRQEDEKNYSAEVFDIIYSYNNLMMYIINFLKYNEMSEINKQYINNKLKDASIYLREANEQFKSLLNIKQIIEQYKWVSRQYSRREARPPRRSH
jgi:hypothetical protein